VPAVEETATEQTEAEKPESEQAETYTKEQLQEKLNAEAKKIRERTERKFNRKLEELRQEVNAKTAPKEEVKAKPTLDQFDSLEEYTDALTDYKLELKAQKEREDAAANEAKQRQTQLKSTFQERQNEFKSKVADYDEVVAEIAEIKLSSAIIETLAESELGPQLAYHFGKNPEELERINELSPISAAREIGKLEAKLSSTEKPPKKQSSAPNPITPVSTRSSDSGLSDNLPAEEWIKRRNAQLRSKG